MLDGDGLLDLSLKPYKQALKRSPFNHMTSKMDKGWNSLFKIF